MKYHIRCDTCLLEWTTKGPGHSVFYQYKNDDGTRCYKPDFWPLWIAPLDPDNLASTKGEKYDGVNPRFAVFLFGPYEQETLDTAEFWAEALKTLTDLGPRLVFQMACQHRVTTHLGEV